MVEAKNVRDILRVALEDGFVAGASIVRPGPRRWSSSRGMSEALCLLIVATYIFAVRPDPVVAVDLPGIAVVTHRGIEIESIGREDLGRLFLTLTNSVGAVRLKVVNLSDRDLKLKFLERITGMSGRQIEQHFIEVELRGEGKWPPEVNDAGELVRLIVNSRNVIGWIPVSELDNLRGRYRNAIKVISIDGRRPGDDGYLLGSSPRF